MAIDLPDSTEVAYEKFVNDMAAWRHRLDDVLATLMDANDNPGDWILGVYKRLRALRDYLNEFILLPNLNTVAQDVEGNQTYDCVAECSATITAITGCLAWVDSTFPASGGYILEKQISDGDVTIRQFTPNQVQNVPTPEDSLVANIQSVRDTMAN